MKKTLIKMTVEDWEDMFKPLPNHIDPNASWQSTRADGQDENGIMFETYGAEHEFVLSQEPNHIWTYADGSDGTYIVEGYNYVNRIGYFITRSPWSNNEIYQIQVSKNEEE